MHCPYDRAPFVATESGPCVILATGAHPQVSGGPGRHFGSEVVRLGR